MRALWDELKITKQHRSPYSVKPITVLGMDTETVEGRVELLADETGDYIHPYSFEDIVHFLLDRHKHRGKKVVFFNLKYDIQSILKWLDPAIWVKLHYDMMVEFSVNKIKYKILYLPKKKFTLSREKKSVQCFDIYQFYRMSLNKAARRYLGKSKIADVDREFLTMQDMKNSKVIEYCIQDAYLAGELTRYLLKTHQERMPDAAPSLISTAGMSERYFVNKCDIPTINGLYRNQPEVIQAAYESYRGGWFQTYWKGFFDRVWKYDINSAYPYQMAQLPDIRQLHWRRIKRSEQALQDAVMGFVKVRTPDEHRGYSYLCPIGLDIKGRMLYMKGDFETWITLKEFFTYREEYIEPLKILDAWIGIPRKGEKLRYPFRDAIHNLYQWKQTEQDPAFRYLVKIILNSIYGKTIQKTQTSDGEWRTGNLFNPIYASYITAGTRVQIYEAIKVPIGIIDIATDSIMARKPLDLDINEDLGGWSQEYQGPAFIIGAGFYGLEEKPEFKTRGFKGADIRREKLLEDAEYPVLEYMQSEPVSLAQAVVWNRHQEMNCFQERKKILDINFDYRRLWKDEFENVGEILTKQIGSEPWDYYQYMEHVNPGLEDYDLKANLKSEILYFIRQNGGFTRTGETERLTFKESRYPGLVTKRGISPDYMREALTEAGLIKENSDIADMMNIIEKELLRVKKRLDMV